MALRVAKSNAPKIGRSRVVPSDHFSSWGYAAVTSTVLAVALIGPQTASLGTGTTSLLCLAILVFGLPHGSLDIALLRQNMSMRHSRAIATVALYLGLASATYALWHGLPVAALTSFLVIAAIHFADDWAGDLPPFFAIGTAAAMLTAPALLHHQTIADIFVALTGQPSAVIVADLSILVAPVALIAACSGVWLMLREGKTGRAIETIAMVGGMVLLPPLVGFAIFFCLSHSPRHLASARAELRGHDREALLLTCAALGIAVWLYMLRNDMVVADKAVFAAFVTLSVLTVPHMLVPLVVKRFT